MVQQNNDNRDPRLEQILDMLVKLANGDLAARLPLPEGTDQLDMIVTGLNMLAEELSASVAAEAALRKNLEGQVRERTAELEEKVRTIREQSNAIMELSTPIMRIWEHILVLPIIGIVDSTRGQLILETLLDTITKLQAQIAIIDITGVPSVDSAAVGYFLETFRAARTLGAEVILTGVSPANALVLAKLGADMSQLIPKGSLHKGLQLALMKMGYRIVGGD